MPQDVPPTTKEAPVEPQVVEVHKEKFTSYHHPYHPARQQSFQKEGGHQQSYVPRWQQRGYQQSNKW